MGIARPIFYLKVSVMIKQKSDPFLAQTLVMLAVLLVMYVIGGDSGGIEHLLAAR